MSSHISTSTVVPKPRAEQTTASSPVESALLWRRRLALAYARNCIKPPLQTEVSERIGSLLDRRQ